MRRSHSDSETSVGLFAFLDVLMSTMGSLILVLMIVSPKIRQEKMAKAATEAARDIVKVEPAPAPAPVPLPAPVVAPPRETIDLNAKFAKRVAELSGQADDKRRTAAEKERSLAAQRESFEKIRAQREQLERELAELHTTKDHTLASAQDLAAEGLRVESELAKRGSRLRKIRDQIAHESTEYSFVAYDGVSGTTRRPILIECADDQIRFPQENITLSASETTGFSSAANPVLAGAEALLEYWTTHSKPDDPKPYVLLVVRPSGTLAYYRARNLLQRMQSPFGYELLSEDQKLAAPAADKEAFSACRQAIDQAIAKRESVFDQALANGRGLSTRNRWRRGGGSSSSDGPNGGRIGTPEKPGAPFDDPFDLTSGGSKGTGKGPGGESLVATGNSVTGNSTTSGAVPGAGGTGTGSGGTGGLGPPSTNATGTNATGMASKGAGPSGVASDHVGGAGLGSGTTGPGGFGSNAVGPGGGSSDGLASGDLAGGASKGAGDANGLTGTADPNNSAANGANGNAKIGSDQRGSNQKGNEGGKPVASLAGSAGVESVGGGSPRPDVNAESGIGRADAAFQLSPAPGTPRTGGGDGKVNEAAGDVNFESIARQARASDSQAGHASLNAGSPDAVSGGFGSAPTTPIASAGSGLPPLIPVGGGMPGSGSPNNGSSGSGFSGGGFSGGGAGQADPSSTASGQPGSAPQISSGMAGGGGTPDGSGLPGGSPSGGSPGADPGGESGQGGGGSADPSSGGGGMPSFGQSSDGSPNGSFARRRWGYSSSQASIGFEHDLTIWIGARAIVVGGQPPVPISRADSVQRLAALVVPAIDREARAWGRPPDHLYWVPNVKFVVSPGGNLPYERLRPVVERHGLVSSVDYCLEPDSPRQTFQSWVQ